MSNQRKLTPIERLNYSTVRIEVEKQNGRKSYGTGFFYIVRIDEEGAIMTIVTNKHVIKDAQSIVFLFTLADANDNPVDQKHYPVKLDDPTKRIVLHPEVDVDLCAIRVGDVFNKIFNENKVNIFYCHLDSSLLPTQKDIEEFDALEDIIMIGYPNAIWDAHNNKPIMRRGITATHPKFDYNRKSEFLIDAACFNGSSGSPVFLIRKIQFENDQGFWEVGMSKILLLGILYAGPMHRVVGEISFERTIHHTQPKPPSVVSHIPNNLGYVIKSAKILDLENIIKSKYRPLLGN